MTRARAWWHGLPAVQKATAAGISLGGLAVAMALTLAGYVRLPAQVEDHETRITTLEESDRFKTCWMLEMGAGRDVNPCRYLLDNPDEFRPPFNGAP